MRIIPQTRRRFLGSSVTALSISNFAVGTEARVMTVYPDVLAAIRAYDHARGRWLRSLGAVKALLDRFPSDDAELHSRFYRLESRIHSARVDALAAASDALFGLLADRGYEAVLYLGRVYFRRVDLATPMGHLLDDADHSFRLGSMLMLGSEGQSLGVMG